MNDFKKVFALFCILLGLAPLLLVLTGNVNDEMLLNKTILTFLGFVLAAIGIDRWHHKEEVTDGLLELRKNSLSRTIELKEIKKKISRIAALEIISGLDEIMLETKAGLRLTNSRIRATSFKISGSDTSSDYYERVVDFVNRTNSSSYECCFNIGHPMSNRKVAFQNVNSESKHKVIHYEFESQAYFNFLIFDNKLALLGFPTSINSPSMEFVFKLNGYNIKERIVIEKLIDWYDNVLKANGDIKNLDEILNN